MSEYKKKREIENHDPLSNSQAHETTAYAGSYLRGIFSHDKTDWETPPELFDPLNELFHFGTDVCATSENAKCINYYSPEENGLAQDWRGHCWMNPPYGGEIRQWVAKAVESTLWGTITVCLLPARTDTGWWHDFIARATHVEFIRHRVRFVGAKSSAPFPSALVVFAPEGTELSDLLGIGRKNGNSILGGAFQGRGWVVTQVNTVGN